MDKPSLKPLKNSFDESETEVQLKRAFIGVFEDKLRDKEREVNLYGMPHLGSQKLQAKFVKQDGLALILKDDESFGYIFRAWRARNRMRGLHFLRTYLQFIWADEYTVEQMWQDKRVPYPTRLVGGNIGERDELNYYLTSRIVVSVSDFSEDGAGIYSALSSIKTTLAAKYVLEMRLLKKFGNTTANKTGLAVASASTFGGVVELFGAVKDKEAYSMAMPYMSASTYRGVVEMSGKIID